MRTQARDLARVKVNIERNLDQMENWQDDGVQSLKNHELTLINENKRLQEQSGFEKQELEKLKQVFHSSNFSNTHDEYQM